MRFLSEMSKYPRQWCQVKYQILVSSANWKLEWFEWVMFQDETAPFLDDVLKLSCYLGPSIDIGPSMTAKILTENGQALHQSMYRLLSQDELLDKDGSDV